VSAIPGELRDQLIRKLEAAIDERDAQLRTLGSDADQLRRHVGALQADLDAVRALSNGMQRELDVTTATIDAERRHAAARLDQLRAHAERQQRDLAAALEAAHRAHRADWQQLDKELEATRHARHEREAGLRRAAARAVDDAESILSGCDANDVSVMDLGGEALSARQRAADARSVVTADTVSGAEAIACARAAHDAASALVDRLRVRQATVERLRASLTADAQWLDDLNAGRPVETLCDQQDHVAALLSHEKTLAAMLIDRHVRQAAAAITRWNGSAAAAARIDAIRNRLAEEILQARRALPDAVDHERHRYALDWLWRALELRFGSIRDDGDQTAGDWSDTSDRKSTYRFRLRSAAGELEVAVPWAGAVLVSLDRHLELREPRPETVADGAQWIGALKERWTELAARLDNPAWGPGHG
jgi:hypothetical protein